MQERDESFCHGAPSEGLMTVDQWSQVAATALLTIRERQVCEHLFAGKTRVAIGKELGIKERTVRQHLEAIHSKLNVQSRVGVVLRVIQIRDKLSETQKKKK